MQGERDLDRAQRARQVAAGVLDGADHLFAQLRRELLESRIVERAQLRGVVDRFEKGHRWQSPDRSAAEYSPMLAVSHPDNLARAGVTLSSGEVLLEPVRRLGEGVALPLVEPMRPFTRRPRADAELDRTPLASPALGL